MIIECDQCNTKFRLDDSRISPNGVKVRCTKCQNVFIVTPPPPPEEVLVEEVFGPDTPFMSKGGEGPDAARSEAAQETGGAEEESASWGVFNSNGEGAPDKPVEKQEAADEGRDIDDGRNEPPELSFGGPDFSSLTGLSGQAATAGDEGGEKTDGPWFTGAAGEDDGFPEDGPADTPASGETPFADNIAPPDEPLADEGFDVTAPEEYEGVKPPFDEFDFGLDDDEQDDAEKDNAAGDWGAREEEAPAGSPAGFRNYSEEDASEDTPIEAPEDTPEAAPGDGFSLTPPPGPPAKQSESGAGEKVIPFSTGYNRNGKTTKTGAGEVNRFEDLFSRTLSEKDTEDAGDSAPLDEDETDDTGDLEFDKDELPPESAPEAVEEAPAPRHYAAGRGLFLVALIFILGAGAIYYSGIIDTLARTLTSTPQAEAVKIETISGYIAENKHFGRFFVIEATIKNTSNEAQIIERITGVIYDSRGRSIATRSVSPGRMVTEDDLKNLTKAELLSRFSDSSGGVIPPMGTVPVMVPFTEIPAGLAEYGLKIIRE